MKPRRLPRFRMSFATACFYVALIVFEPSYYTALPLLAAALHEGGHLVAMLACGRRVDSVRVYPFGIEIGSDASGTSYRADFLVSLAGVGANLLAWALAFPHAEHPAAAVFAASNLLLAAINLFPVRCLDGGEALRTLLYLRREPDAAERILRRVSFFAVTGLWVVATYLLLATGYNFSLFAMALYLFAASFLHPDSPRP